MSLTCDKKESSIILQLASRLLILFYRNIHNVIKLFNCRAHNVNTLLDLRGCTFAYSDEESLSGSKIVLKTLKEKGENASFFGSLLSTVIYYITSLCPVLRPR